MVVLHLCWVKRVLNIIRGQAFFFPLLVSHSVLDCYFRLLYYHHTATYGLHCLYYKFMAFLFLNCLGEPREDKSSFCNILLLVKTFISSLWLYFHNNIAVGVAEVCPRPLPILQITLARAGIVV